MSEVLTLPVALSSEGCRRMAGRLGSDARAGVDLGPREAQIEGLTASRNRSLPELREALGRAVAVLPEGDPALCDLRDAVFGMTRIADVVIAGAAGLPERPGMPA
jgi:hypothetical protein